VFEMTMYISKNVKSTFVHNTTQWAWADIEGVGFKRIKDGYPDGVTNIFTLLCIAKASGRKVNVDIDADGMITTAYLL
jgi:hypothetical protein